MRGWLLGQWLGSPQSLRAHQDGPESAAPQLVCTSLGSLQLCQPPAGASLAPGMGWHQVARSPVWGCLEGWGQLTGCWGPGRAGASVVTGSGPYQPHCCPSHGHASLGIGMPWLPLGRPCTSAQPPALGGDQQKRNCSPLSSETPKLSLLCHILLVLQAPSALSGRELQ